MDIIASRTRITGSAPRYCYRALVPLDEVNPARRHRVAILQVQTPTTRLPCTRIADTMAPDRWFERNLAVPCGLAARLNLVGRRVEGIILRSVFPEMMTHLAPLALLLDHDPGSAVHRFATIDLNAAFDAIAPRIDVLMPPDLGLHLGADRRAA
ncbi:MULTISPECIES: hypothetical protein [Sphingobium]|jgi:hypothetical protein|uniref:Uncharacterized protein n=1 Tax=Sphingobium yanoikuyae TaxID=13690 RepID=A0AA42X151_SPHYA|nr:MULTISPECIES: hypothetical protein [Sphingobium]MBV2150345.1 hypothetical protein [Sphingobium sp. AS12]MDH2134032.1 hypothetical protein [Sphingobium yanoikuyae]MDH2148674.1 hypothetical protein [Sphingobium yanoikuyae]MDH2165505.1 hypothetical protein [Sphingobium yanoikuyae]QWT14283.1 hypothetical protein GTV57_00250 [Sphingobium xenophagum]|tara:strand:- start:6218 stop:6679 length:462 start_codon:yes stop_codon:yes gene_type:complete